MKRTMLTSKRMRISVDANGVVKCQRPCTHGVGRWTTFSTRIFDGGQEEFRRWAREYIRTVEGLADADITEA